MENDKHERNQPEWLQKTDLYLRFFIDVPITIAGSLYKQLPMNEDEFSRVAATAWADGRSYYLYGAADEVTKAGMAILRWGEFLSGPNEPVVDDPRERLINRLCLESIHNEQRMWQRKLTEWLVNLICFCNTNRQEYFCLFLAAEAYDCALADLCDLKDYYDCDSNNERSGLEWIRERLCENLVVVNNNDCWFLKSEVHKKLPERPGRMFTSMATRLSRAMNSATNWERLCLGVSYVGGFGKASRSVHPIIADPHPPVTEYDVESTLRRVSLLCMHIVDRAHQLASLEPIGLAKRISTHFQEQDIAGEVIKERYQPNFEIGDIVLTLGHLAEIIDKHISSYGLESYKVRFLVKGPIGDTEDCVPADWTKAILRKSWSRDYLRYHWSKKPETQDLLSLLDSATDENLTGSLIYVLVKFEKMGIPLLPLVPPSQEEDIENLDDDRQSDVL